MKTNGNESKEYIRGVIDGLTRSAVINMDKDTGGDAILAAKFIIDMAEIFDKFLGDGNQVLPVKRELGMV